MPNAYAIKWLGFNEAPNYDRIFGHLQMSDGRNYAFWGIKGKPIEFKKHDFVGKIAFLINQYERKGFKQIHPTHYEMICKNFQEDFEIWFTAYVLKEE